MLETNTVTPLLKRMETSGLVTRSKGERDARQTIVTLTAKGAAMKNKMTCIPDKVGSAVICDSLTPETVPTLFRMLDDIILKLKP